MQYKLNQNSIPGILKIEDDGTISCVPESTENMDWQDYQDWLAADPANQPLPADA